MRLHVLRTLTIASTITFAGLTAPAEAQMSVPRGSSPAYPYAYYGQGARTPRYYYPAGQYRVPYGYGNRGWSGSPYRAGRSERFLRPTGRGVPLAKPWISR